MAIATAARCSYESEVDVRVLFWSTSPTNRVGQGDAKSTNWFEGRSIGRYSRVIGMGQHPGNAEDIARLERAIELADIAVKEGNHPFGAVLVSAEGQVLAEGMNSHSVDGGPGHAEANLARDAARRFDIPTLREATLYTSVEPCTMCAGTIYWAEIGATVFGMTERRLGELAGDDPENPTQDLGCRTVFASGRRPVEVRGPFPELEERIAAQHRAFWKSAT